MNSFDIPYISKVISAHRMPDLLFQYAEKAIESYDIIIAGAGGAAHLPGMLKAKTTVPVLGVPVESKVLNGLDSLLSIIQMPSGSPVATFGIGITGARNAAYFAVEILMYKYPIFNLYNKYIKFRTKQTNNALNMKQDRKEK